MKRKVWIAIVLGLALLLAAVGSSAAEDPITISMEISPNKLTALQAVDVTITIANTGTDATPIAVTLFDPTTHEVTDFGTEGVVQLAGGESKTWTGKWEVRQIQLDTGYIYYYITYDLADASGTMAEQKRSVRSQISMVDSITDIEVKRTISPSAARKDQKVTVKYDLINRGNVALQNVTVQEDKSIDSKAKTVESIAPGEQAEIKFEVTMGTKDLTSAATVTYVTEKDSKKQTKEVDPATITYGEPKLSAKLSASEKGVDINGTVVLTLDLTNSGNVDYSDIRVTDSTLGEVFTNQQLPAGEKLSLTKEVTLTETTDYQFTVNAVDNTGTSVSATTEAAKVSVIDPTKQPHLSVTITPDRTEVYESPGLVRFSIQIVNDGPVDAENVDISHGSVKLYTFASIPAGETRTLTRDTALSQAGKFRFTASLLDAAENTLSFDSNDINIAFSVPTAAPATPTPPPVPTQVPTFQPTVMPGILDPSIGPVPKAIRNVLLPAMIVLGVLFLGSGVLLLIATKKRSDLKRASEAAYDHLERVRRRDYRTPGEPEAATVKPMDATDDDMARSDSGELELGDGELPHVKYAREALERRGEQDAESGLADEEPLDMDNASFADIYRRSSQAADSYADDYDADYDADYNPYAPPAEEPADDDSQQAEADYDAFAPYDDPAYAAQAEQDGYDEGDAPEDGSEPTPRRHRRTPHGSTTDAGM